MNEPKRWPPSNVPMASSRVNASMASPRVNSRSEAEQSLRNQIAELEKKSTMQSLQAQQKLQQQQRRAMETDDDDDDYSDCSKNPTSRAMESTSPKLKKKKSSLQFFKKSSSKNKLRESSEPSTPRSKSRDDHRTHGPSSSTSPPPPPPQTGKKKTNDRLTVKLNELNNISTLATYDKPNVSDAKNLVGHDENASGPFVKNLEKTIALRFDHIDECIEHIMGRLADRTSDHTMMRCAVIEAVEDFEKRMAVKRIVPTSTPVATTTTTTSSSNLEKRIMGIDELDLITIKTKTDASLRSIALCEKTMTTTTATLAKIVEKIMSMSIHQEMITKELMKSQSNATHANNNASSSSEKKDTYSVGERLTINRLNSIIEMQKKQNDLICEMVFMLQAVCLKAEVTFDEEGRIVFSDEEGEEEKETNEEDEEDDDAHYYHR